MTVNFCSDSCRFYTNLVFKNGTWKELALSVKTPFELLVKLAKYGYPVTEGYRGTYPTITAMASGYFYVGSINKRFYSLREAILSFETKFETKKMYRFVYNGGTRSGEKRAVVVDEVHADHILCRDLNTNDIKNYLFSKITEIEEIK